MLEREKFNRDFGERVRLARKVAEKTAEKIAEDAGLTPQFLSDVERGKKGMSNYNLARLSEALGVSTDYLLFGRAGVSGKKDAMDKRLTALSPAAREMAEEIVRHALEMLQGNILR